MSNGLSKKSFNSKSLLERNYGFSAVSTSNIFQKNILLIDIAKTTN